MSNAAKAWRALLVGGAEQRSDLELLFDHSALQHWRAVPSENVEQARFFMQMHACDAVLIDESVSLQSSLSALRWLTERSTIPLLFLSSIEPELIEQVLAIGVQHWLPRELVLAQPSLLATALEQTLLVRAKSRRIEHVEVELAECRQQISRLVGLLWDLTPMQGQPRWYSQRYMLERLHEEMLRRERYNSPLSLVLGEVWPGEEQSFPPILPEPVHPSEPPSQLTSVTAERVTRCKRRSDVVGQYGLNGFMLLLPSTDRLGAEDCSHRIQEMIQQSPWEPEPTVAVPLKSCMGVASVASEKLSAKSLLRRAEQQLEIARQTV